MYIEDFAVVVVGVLSRLVWKCQQFEGPRLLLDRPELRNEREFSNTVTKFRIWRTGNYLTCQAIRWN